MKARVIFLVLFVRSLHLECATVSQKFSDAPNIIGKSITELSPLLISVGLDDIIIISAPIINKHATYYLSRPNGDSMKLHLNTSRVMTNYNKISRGNDNRNDIVIHNAEGKLKTIVTAVNKRIYNVNYPNNCYAATNGFVDKKINLLANDFTIGPLGEDDHGNWVLSTYFKGRDGEWVELFQVITIEIVDFLPTYPPNSKLISGDTFRPRFEYTIENLESCQITSPRSTFDRFYDRDMDYLDSCGFRIPNVTKEDEGSWKILGVGKIVYEGDLYLEIYDKVL